MVTVKFRGISPFTCQLDFQRPKPCTSPVIYTGLSAGRHRVDITGRNRTCEANTTFIIPGKLLYFLKQLSVKFMPYHFYIKFTVWLNVGTPVVNCDTVRVNFSANGRTECKLDDGKFKYCRSPYYKSWLSNGKHTITIRASDGLGGYETQRLSFTVQLGM